MGASGGTGTPGLQRRGGTGKRRDGAVTDRPSSRRASGRRRSERSPRAWPCAPHVRGWILQTAVGSVEGLHERPQVPFDVVRAVDPVPVRLVDRLLADVDTGCDRVRVMSIDV